MKRIHALISGEVQGVGYRETVKRIAFELNICGWVMNQEDGRVELTAEGENKNIEEFLRRINIRKYPVFVEEIKAGEEAYKGEFRSFRVIRDKDLQKEILAAISGGTLEIHEMKEILLGVKEDTSAIKQDTSAMKQDMKTGFREVKEEIHLMRDDFREMFMREVGELRSEIAEIKATLARMQATG